MNKSNSPLRLVLDAGAGTRLIAAGLKLPDDNPALWVVDHPEAVAANHRADVAAGSDCVLTCTCDANRYWLDRWGRSGEVARINAQAAVLAREAAGPDRLVLGSIGANARGDNLLEQAEALADAGVDGLVLETGYAYSTEPAVRLLAGRVGIPIIASTFILLKPDEAQRMVDAGAAAVGVNCCSGLPNFPKWARRIREVVSVPIWCKPSPGLPGSIELPAVFSSRLASLWDLAPIALGGCCGSTDAHVSALAATRPPDPGGNPPRTPRDAWLSALGGV